MKSWTAVVVAAMWSTTVAQSYKLPVQRVTYGWDFSWMQQSQYPGIPQDPLSTSSYKKSSAQIFDAQRKKKRQEPSQDYRPRNIPLQAISEDNIVWTSIFMTTLGVGNPPVQVRAQVDTSWGPLFVPSTYCASKACEEHWEHMYYPLNSSTSRTNFTNCEVVYAGQYGLWTRGIQTEDSVHIGNMEVKNQIFESVTDWWSYELERADLYDSALGLAFRKIVENDTTLDSPSLFQSMIHQELLSKNLFTLRTARTDDEVGELTLGSIPDYIDEHDLVNIPLTQNYDGESQAIKFFASSGWQVALNDISLSHNDSASQSVFTPNATAILSTSYPWIVLPWNYTKKIHEQLGFDTLVPCDERHRLPNVTFTFGPDGQQITLTPWDYLLEVYHDSSKKYICQVMFGGAEETQLEGFVILGSVFFSGLYSVWDADREIISLANRPR